MIGDPWPPTKRQIDELGDRLRRARTPAEIDPEDRMSLEEVLIEYDARGWGAHDTIADTLRGVPDEDQRDSLPMEWERVRLPGSRTRLAVTVTSRTKTLGTILEKLRRQPHLTLGAMWDLTGVRVVVDGTREDQDRVCEHVQRLFPGAKLVDRRKKPNHGYRAVHLIVQRHGYPVEVQIRTVLQDLWAQIVEKLGDVWGREIRYGGEPSDPDREAAPGYTRRELWRFLLYFSDVIDRLEESLVRIPDTRRRAAEIPFYRPLRWRLVIQLLLLEWDMRRLQRSARGVLVALKRWAAGEAPRREVV